MKKLKYLFFVLPFLFVLNVSALTELGYKTPTFMTYTDIDGVIHSTSLNQNIPLPFYGLRSDFASFGVNNSYEYLLQIKTNFILNSNLSVNDVVFYSDNVSCTTLALNLNGTNNGHYYSNFSFHCNNNGTDLSMQIPYSISRKVSAANSGTGKIEYYWYRYNPLEDSSDDVINSINSNTDTIVNNQNQNTQDIIDNLAQNNQEIINNLVDNTQDIIDNQNANAQETQNTINENLGQFCRPSTNLFLHDDVSFTNAGVNVNYLKGVFILDGTTSSGNFIIGTSSASSPNRFTFGTFPAGRYYLRIKKIGGSLSQVSGSSGMYIRVGTDNSILFSTDFNRNTDFYGRVFTLDNEETLSLSYYVNQSGWIFNNYQLQFQLVKGDQVLPFEEPGATICKNKLDDLNSGINDVNDTLTNSNVDSGTGNSFFSDFTSEDFGLSQIITIPLNTIQSLTSKTCVPLNVPIPFTNSNITLPCMTEIYETKFPSIYNLWKIVSFGIIAYLIAIDIFHIVKGFKDPESDKVEVLDL